MSVEGSYTGKCAKDVALSHEPQQVVFKCRCWSVTWHVCSWMSCRFIQRPMVICVFGALLGGATFGLGWGPEPGPCRFQARYLTDWATPPRGPRGSYLVKLLLYFLFALVSRASILETARARVDVRAAVRMDKTVHPHRDFQTRTRLPDTEICFCTWNGDSAWFNPIAGPGSGSDWIWNCGIENRVSVVHVTS